MLRALWQVEVKGKEISITFITTAFSKRMQTKAKSRHVSGSYPQRLKISSKSFRLLPLDLQSDHISSETFLLPSDLGVKILLALDLIASGLRWCSPTWNLGARASCTSGISSVSSKGSIHSGTCIVPLSESTGALLACLPSFLSWTGVSDLSLGQSGWRSGKTA